MAQLPVPAKPTAPMPYGVQTPTDRAETAKQIRVQAAEFERGRDLPSHYDNGDESLYDAKYGSYSKGLKHDEFGVVDPGSYRALHLAVSTGAPQHFQNIPLGGNIKFVNPQAGLAFDLEGADSHALSLPPSPAVASAERAAEMIELYWMALCRDVAFSDYGTDPTVAMAIQELNSLGSAFKGAKDPVTQKVTPQTVFRGATPGETDGPYISQFFLQSAGFGDLASAYDSAGYQGQLYNAYVKNLDYMTDWDCWKAVQDGMSPFDPVPANLQFGPNQYQLISGTKTCSPCTCLPMAPVPDYKKCNPLLDPTKPLSVEQRDAFYLHSGRMGAAFVHVDELYQAYFMAALNLLDSLKFNTYDENLPYQPTQASSATEAGFGTFGNPHVATLVAEVATRALKAQWYQKWFVHRTLRPEAYGGMVHATMAKAAGDPKFANAPMFPIHPSVLCSQAIQQVHAKYGTWLLPMAFPEGSPQHPSYGSGHATVAGACATIIKAFFQEEMLITCIVEPDPAHAFKQLREYTAPPPPPPPTPAPAPLTIMSEANKIAGNVGMFRNHAGVHWRSDHEQSIYLGEQIAISILQDQKFLYNESFPGGWTFTTFKGEKVSI